MCTDKDQNIILQNTEEFLSESEISNKEAEGVGRMVGMVMIPGEHIQYIKVKKVHF